MPLGRNEQLAGRGGVQSSDVTPVAPTKPSGVSRRSLLSLIVAAGAALSIPGCKETPKPPTTIDEVKRTLDKTGLPFIGFTKSLANSLGKSLETALNRVQLTSLLESNEVNFTVGRSEASPKPDLTRPANQNVPSDYLAAVSFDFHRERPDAVSFTLLYDPENNNKVTKLTFTTMDGTYNNLLTKNEVTIEQGALVRREVAEYDSYKIDPSRNAPPVGKVLGKSGNGITQDDLVRFEGAARTFVAVLNGLDISIPSAKPTPKPK